MDKPGPSEGVEMWGGASCFPGGSLPRADGGRGSSPEEMFKNRGPKTPFPAISGSNKKETVGNELRK